MAKGFDTKQLRKKSGRNKQKQQPANILSIEQALDLGISHHQAGRFQQAEQLYKQVLQVQPNNPEALHFWGLLARQVGNPQAAVDLISKAIQIQPNWAQAHSNLGTALKEQGKLEEAAQSFRHSLQLEPNWVEAYYNLGNVCQQQGKFEEEAHCYRQLLKLKPDSVKVYNKLGIALAKQGKFEEAAQTYRQLLKLEPDSATAHNNLGNALKEQGELEEAIGSYRQALELEPDYLDAQSNLGIALMEQGNLEEAAQSFQQALKLKPDSLEAHVSLGSIYKRQEKLDEAVQSYCQALQLKPDYVQAHASLGRIYQRQEKLDEAIQSYRQALELEPNFVEVHNNLGVALKEQGKLEEAIGSYRQALELEPDYAEAHANLGSALKEKGIEEAIGSYRQALELEPDYLKAHINLGIALKEQGNFEEAIQSYLQALQLEPDCWIAHNNLGIALNHQEKLGKKAIKPYLKAVKERNFVDANYTLGIAFNKQRNFTVAIPCFRRALQLNPDYLVAHNNLAGTLLNQGKFEESIEAFRQALKVKPDFTAAHNNLLFVLGASASLEPEVMLQEALGWYDQQVVAQGLTTLSHHNDRNPDRRLRIGYVSGDFKTHAVSYFIEPVIKAHHRSEVEVYCYAHVPQPDAVSRRIQAAAHWRSTVGKSDAQVAELIQQDQIDILIDLAGHTGGNRLKIFGMKPAPVQATYLGYFATTGLPTIDYWITDYALHPEDTIEKTAEEIWRLPRCYVSYQPHQSAPAVSPPPCLSSGTVTFGSFNNLNKVTKTTVELWAKVLKAVPDSRMLMKSTNLVDLNERQRIQQMFAEQGISLERLLLRGSTPSMKDHLGMYGEVDICLDTAPYTGCTTTCDALWMGVPIITLAGARKVERMSTSILQAIGREEWIASSVEEFVEKAVRFSSDPDRLGQIREQQRELLERSPLRDPDSLARALEQAYRSMWQRYLQEESQPSLGTESSSVSNQSASTSSAPVQQNQLLIEIEGGVKICVEDNLERMTTYILLEQEDWFEAEMEFVRKLVTPGMQIIDIGANHGVYTLTMAKLLQGQGQITAYEPANSVFTLLQKSVEANALNTVDIVNRGLSDREGEATLFLSENSELNSLKQGGASQGQDKIQLLALDRELERRGWQDISFVKLDAEGEEAKILIGGRQFFLEQSPLVMFELKHGQQVNLPLIQLFQVLGYKIYRLVPGLGLLSPCDTSQPFDGYQLNLFACKDDRAQQLAERKLLVREIQEKPAIPKPSYWLEAMATLSYAKPFLSQWEKFAASPTAESQAYLEGLNYFFLAKAADISPPEQLAALQYSFERLQQAAQAKESFSRACTLARVAAEFGQRQVSVKALQQLVTAIDSDQQSKIDEPLLPVNRQYDNQLLNSNLKDWLFVSIFETYENSKVFSSYFSAQQSVNLLSKVIQKPFHSLQAERRLQLAKKRLDRQYKLETSPALSQRSKDHLNSDYWQQMLVTRSEPTNDPPFRYVFCTGMPRSGSTWSYNVARLLLQEAFGADSVVAGFFGEEQKVDSAIKQFSSNDKILLLKFHQPTETTFKETSSGRARAIFTYREPLNAIASLVDFFKFPWQYCVSATNEALKCMMKWKQVKHTVLVQFNNLTSQPDQEIRRIATHLGLTVSEEVIGRVAEQTSYEAMKKHAEQLGEQPKEKLVRNGSSGYDPVTLLHIGHLPQGTNRDWKTQFTVEEKQYAIQQLSQWLDKEGQLKQEFWEE